jgi:predicted dehydrogenase
MIRLGVIGAGAAIRHIHWPVLCGMADDIQVVAVASRNPENAKAFADLAGGAVVYEDYRRLIEDRDVDAILTAVPIDLSGTVLIDAIRSDKHVLAEKPIAETPKEARRVLTECRKHRRIVAIGENFRYRSDVGKAQELIQRDEIGTVFAFQLSVKFDLDAAARQVWVTKEWRKKSLHAGGFLLDAGVHPIAALRDLLGDVVEVHACVLDHSRVLKGPDSLLAQLKLANGVVGQLFFCYTAKVEQETPLELAIYGTAGTVSVLNGRVVWTKGVDNRARVYDSDPSDRGYVRQWKNFCAAIRGEEALISTPERAYGDVVVLDAAVRSARNGCTVRLLPGQGS